MDKSEESTDSFSDHRPANNIRICLSGVGGGAICSLFGPFLFGRFVAPPAADVLYILFYGMVIGYAIGVGPGIIIGGRLLSISGRWWGAVLGSLLGFGMVYYLSTWFRDDSFSLAYFIVPPLLGLAGYQPIRPCLSSRKPSGGS